MKNLLIFFLVLTMSPMFAQCISGDCITGEGTKKYTNGNKYQGNFKDGKRNGYGKFIWATGSKYKGQWVNNKRQGKGEEILADGTSYVGDFNNDQKHGNGTLYDKNKNVIKKGTWTNGIYSGTGGNNNQTIVQQDRNNNIKPANSSAPKIINLGLGVGSFYGFDSYAFRNSSTSSIPPVSISVDFPSSKTDGLTFGGYFGYTSSKVTLRSDFFGDYGWRSSYFILGGRATYAYNLFNSQKTIPYGSVMLGYNVAKSSYFGDDTFNDGSSAAEGGFTYSGAIGLRHMFNPKTGAFGELGYGIAYLTLGVSLKM
jgi:hypothetical protein